MSTEKLSSGRDLMTIELRCRDMKIAALEAKNAELLAALISTRAVLCRHAFDVDIYDEHLAKIDEVIERNKHDTKS